jgi:hypothetical protein
MVYDRDFYGVKIQVLITEDGIPVEFAFVPGQANDTRGLDKSEFSAL